jgi:FMN reductase
MHRKRRNMVYRLAAVHAGRADASTSGQLTNRLVGAVRELGPAPVVTRVVRVWDLMPSVHAALVTDAWDAPLRQARMTIMAADGIIAVTPIVHGAYSGPFKSFVDVMSTSTWQGKPVLIGACGGTPRHCLAVDHLVRPLFVCLRCMVLPTAVFAATHECEPGGVADALETRIRRAAYELVTATATRPRSSSREPMAVMRGA